MNQPLEQSPYTREEKDPRSVTRFLVMSPWSVQNIVLEVVRLYMLKNNPYDDGFNFSQRYDLDQTKSGIFLDMAYNWNAESVKKRPSIFIQRDAAHTSTPTLGNSINRNVPEAINTKLAVTQMGIRVKCLATNLGFIEQLAGWIRNAFLSYQVEIQRDFGFRKFRLVTISPPSISDEDKEIFEVSLLLDVAFDENFTIQQEALRLKTVSFSVFDSIALTRVNNQ